MVTAELRAEALKMMRNRASFGLPPGRSAEGEALKIGAMLAFGLQLEIFTQAECDEIMQAWAKAACRPVKTRYTNG